MEKYRQILEDDLNEVMVNGVQLIPKLFFGLLGLLAAWLFFAIILFMVKRALKAAKIDMLSKKINDWKLFGDRDIKINLFKIIVSTIRILLLLFFTVIIAQLMGLDAISDGISGIFAYLPTLVSAIVIFVGGLYLATLVKKATLALFESFGIGGSKLISGALFFLIVFFVSITALNQAGIDTDIITSNFTMFLGAFLLAIALGFGLGSRKVFSDLLKMFYARRTFMVGDVVSFGNIEGSIESIDNVSVTINTKKGKVVVPISKVVSKKVWIKE